MNPLQQQQGRGSNEPKFESLVKYGTAFEIPADQPIDQIYRPPNTHLSLMMMMMMTDNEGDGHGDDMEVTEESSIKKKNDKNNLLRHLICTPRNPDGTISNGDLQNILNTILPPITWTENKRMWQKMVSHMPATRQDLRNLQTLLDTYLKQRRARETGLCQIRQELYSQLFDELIRQVTLTCVERGVLLVRIRDEIKDVALSYENLFASATSCAIRKALLAETSKVDMEGKIERTMARIQKKRSCLDKLRRIYAGIDKKNMIRYEDMKAKHASQYATLKQEYQNLKQKLENILLPKKAAPVTQKV